MLSLLAYFPDKWNQAQSNNSPQDSPTLSGLYSNLSLSENFTGSLLCTGLKNREYRIWDSRTSSTVVTWEVLFKYSLYPQGHASPRRSYMTWLGDSYYLVTTGYSRRSNREVVLRDIRNIENSVYTITADNVELCLYHKI